MAADIIMMIATAIAFVIVFQQLFRLIRALSAQKTIRQALTRGTELTPELLDRIDERTTSSPSGGDDRTGLVLVAIGLAMLVYGAIQGDPDDVRNMAGIAMFPLFVGAVLAGRHLLRARREKAAE